MTTLYSYTDLDGDRLELDHGVYGNATGEVSGVHVITVSRGGVTSAVVPDAEVPNFVAALQNYMSRRAKELAKGGGK